MYVPKRCSTGGSVLNGQVEVIERHATEIPNLQAVTLAISVIAKAIWPSPREST